MLATRTPAARLERVPLRATAVEEAFGFRALHAAPAARRIRPPVTVRTADTPHRQASGSMALSVRRSALRGYSWFTYVSIRAISSIARWPSSCLSRFYVGQETASSEASEARS